DLPTPGTVLGVTSPAPRRTRLSTPVRLRVWTSAIVLGALAILAVTSTALARLGDEVRTIGSESAPLAATASDLYCALRALDAQVARLLLIDNAADLAGSQLDALLTYHRRSAEVDADLERIVHAATSDVDRARARQLLDGLATYRQAAWQALAV